jgi:hypothetical protein
MIQFNLLPDVKIDYIKTRRLKRFMILGAFAAVGVSLLALFLTFSYAAIQKTHLKDLDKDIDKISGELDAIPELTKILSVQGQLKTLPDLYNRRPALDRLPGYINQTTPIGVGLNRLSLDLATNHIEVTGTADSLEIINAYVDKLKFTTYKTTDEGSQATQAFSEVVLTQFGRDTEQATFAVSFTFDPTIFDITKTVQLTVPDQVTTHAQTPAGQPFNSSAEGDENAGQ